MTESERIQSIKNNGGCHLQYFKENNITYDMCLTAVKDTGEAIYYVPDQYRTKEIYTLACRSYGHVLCYVPEAFMSREICQSAISNDGTAIEYVPDDLKGRDMYLLAAQNNPSVMQICPDKFLNADFCVEVCKVYGCSAIKALPKALKNNDFYLSLIEKMPELLWQLPKNAHTGIICKAAITVTGYQNTSNAVKENPELLSQLHTSLYDHDTCLAFVNSDFFKENTVEKDWGFNTDSDYEKGLLYLQNHYNDHYSLKHILRWTDIIEIVLKDHPRFIKYVKRNLITYEMCLAAVSQNYSAIYDIPTVFLSEEICLIAFEQEPYSIDAFPEEYCSYDLWMKAVQHSGYLFKNTPEKYKTRELCLAAVMQEGSLIEYVPVEIMDEEICLEAMKHLSGLNWGILEKIPKHLRTASVCLEAVRYDSESLACVPNQCLTYELCLAAASKIYSLSSIPKEFLTEELCEAAVSHSGLAFKDVPSERVTPKICMLAINHGKDYAALALKRCPPEQITQELCDAATKKNIQAIQYVPEQFITKDMLIRVCGIAPGLLPKSLPSNLKTEELISELSSVFPDLETRLRKLL